MKAIILAGGLGTRISEETETKPKPMINIGGHPILWHIMKIYSHYGINDFIICLGYKGYVIKEYFANYMLYQSDLTFNMREDKTIIHCANSEPWSVTLVDTGVNTMTGGRLKRVKDYIGNETFCFTYGDGLSDVSIPKLVEFHKKNGGLATLTAVAPPARYGTLEITDGRASRFKEKPCERENYINGGFFVLEPECIDYIKDDSTAWELEPIERLSMEGKLFAYEHSGFWQSMDTLSEKIKLEQIWESGKVPWKKW